MAQTLPLVYVRGFAGGRTGIDAQTDDPFYGFNLGSTHVRQDANGQPAFYQFPGPLLRLLQQWGYTVLVGGAGGATSVQATPLPNTVGQVQLLRSVEPGALADVRASVWVHRFYDSAADTWDAEAVKFSIAEAADSLLTLIQLVLKATASDQVYLVAHSMGGLIVRSMLQRTCAEQAIAGRDVVRKVFTYATPHAGISSGFARGLFNWLTAELNIDGSAIFEPDSMYEYLTPRDKRSDAARKQFVPNVVPEADYPTERMFCLIGTDNSDYSWLPAKYVGPKSDGLVQIQNAFVPGSNVGYVHRSHSGRYGIVNSEEGYQNLQRFLFGDMRIRLGYDNIALTSPKAGRTFRGELRLAVRGLPVMMHERLISDFSNYELTDGHTDLLTTYLFKKDNGASRWAVHLSVVVEDHIEGFLDITNHIHGVSTWDDTLYVDVTPAGFTYAWMSALGAVPADAQSLDGVPKQTGHTTWTVPMPDSARRILGAAAVIAVTVDDWTAV